jgi:hypothetical protein
VAGTVPCCRPDYPHIPHMRRAAWHSAYVNIAKPLFGRMQVVRRTTLCPCDVYTIHTTNLAPTTSSHTLNAPFLCCTP